MDKLRIIEVQPPRVTPPYETTWSQHPQVYAADSMLDKERLRQTIAMLPPNPINTLDIGCGHGQIARHLACQGHAVTAVDGSAIPLRSLAKQPNIITRVATLPRLPLSDATFDLVICTDILAELPQQHHRLAISEWARLLTPNGTLLCSTPLDTNTIDPQGRFLTLLSTEFAPTKIHLSYHQLARFSPLRCLLVPLECLARFLWPDRPTHIIVYATKSPLKNSAL